MATSDVVSPVVLGRIDLTECPTLLQGNLAVGSWLETKCSPRGNTVSQPRRRTLQACAPVKGDMIDSRTGTHPTRGLFGYTVFDIGGLMYSYRSLLLTLENAYQCEAIIITR